jgi:hypothetical protein
MIISNRRHMLGFSHFGVVKGTTFGCAVCTAPEGLFKGCSTVFSAFDPNCDWLDAHHNRSTHLVAKVLLYPGLSKGQRAKVHESFLAHLDALGNAGRDLATALDEVFATAKEKGLIVGSINQAHTINQAAHADADADADSQQLVALVEDVHTRIGEFPVYVGEDGTVFTHPQLAQELEKPHNERLSEILGSVGKLYAKHRAAEGTT